VPYPGVALYDQVAVVVHLSSVFDLIFVLPQQQQNKAEEKACYELHDKNPPGTGNQKKSNE